MANVFVSHTGDDSLVAFELADSLERHGYSTWYYERNSLPGVCYLTQSAEAIEQSDAVLLIISPRSVTSREVTKEVEHAHRTGKRVIPVLLEILYSEVADRQPAWNVALGTAVAVSIRDGQCEEIVEKIARTLLQDGVAPSVGPDVGQVIRREPGRHRRVWASDANQINTSDLDRVVFRNRTIEDFLLDRGKFFLSANKGLGKTLLLSYKRHLLTSDGRNNQSAICLIPAGRPYLDFMSSPPSISAAHEGFLAKLNNAKRLWGFALRVSVLSQFPHLVGPLHRAKLAHVPDTVVEWLNGEKVDPTIVFKELLSSSVKEIHQAIDSTTNLLARKFKGLHQATYCFIDKVDQALGSLGREAWVHVQAGLIEAAWDAMNANSHVRFFASIRQEAFANYQSEIKANLHGATTVIQYCDSDLRALLDQLTRCYEDQKSFKELIGIHVVREPFQPQTEDSFSFLNRHTLGRPRDLVIIASELSKIRATLSEAIYRRKVREFAASMLISNVFDEMRVFLDRLSKRPARMKLCTLLSSNILSAEDLERVRLEFHPGDPSGDPFAELYNAGLLGVIDAISIAGTRRCKDSSSRMTF